MPTIVVNRPPAISFTDNVSKYVVAGTITNANQKFQVRVFIDDPSAPKATLMFPPYLSTVVAFSLNDIIRSYINFTRPKLDEAVYSTVQRAGHSVQSWIEARVVDPGNSTQPAFVSDAANKLRYIKGGYGYWSNQPDFNFDNPRKWFFTWHRSDKMIGPKEAHWLLYCHPAGAPADREYRVIFTDGTTASLRIPITETDDNPVDRLWDTYFIPTGTEQCALQVLAPQKTIYKYRVRILKRSDSSTLAEFHYQVDYRPNYDAFVLYYRNSLGGWDSLRFLGEWEESSGYTRLDANQDMFPDYAPFDSNAAGANFLYETRERRKWKVNTGHLDKRDIDVLRDFALTKEAAIMRNGTWIPVKPTTETLSGLSTKDMLQNCTLEFESAFENTNYTPDILPWKP